VEVAVVASELVVSTEGAFPNGVFEETVPTKASDVTDTIEARTFLLSVVTVASKLEERSDPKPSGFNVYVWRHPDSLPENPCEEPIKSSIIVERNILLFYFEIAELP
jgi:hypothetical protein